MSADYSSKDPDPYLDLEEDNAEELGDQVQRAKAELEKLRQQQELIEKEKQRLEELKRRQDELETGRAEMLDKLTRSVVVVQREAEETQKRIEQLNAIHSSFAQHLQFIEAINSKAWSTTELPRELSKALSAVEDARADYNKAQAKISVETFDAQASSGSNPYEQEYGSGYGDSGFGTWLRNGIAFTLPLQIIGVLALLVWVWSIVAAQH